MDVECQACGQWHDFTPTELVLITHAFQQGELTTFGRNGLTSRCLLSAFTEENLTYIKRRYPRGALRLFIEIPPLGNVTIPERKNT